MQKPYKKYQTYKIQLAKKIFENYICLPSSSFKIKRYKIRSDNGMKKIILIGAGGHAKSCIDIITV